MGKQYHLRSFEYLSHRLPLARHPPLRSFEQDQNRRARDRANWSSALRHHLERTIGKRHQHFRLSDKRLFAAYGAEHRPLRSYEPGLDRSAWLRHPTLRPFGQQEHCRMCVVHSLNRQFGQMTLRTTKQYIRIWKICQRNRDRKAYVAGVRSLPFTFQPNITWATKKVKGKDPTPFHVTS